MDLDRQTITDLVQVAITASLKEFKADLKEDLMSIVEKHSLTCGYRNDKVAISAGLKFYAGVVSLISVAAMIVAILT